MEGRMVEQQKTKLIDKTMLIVLTVEKQQFKKHLTPTYGETKIRNE